MSQYVWCVCVCKVMDGATKKDREMVAVKTHRERVRWLPHEDSFVSVLQHTATP